MLYLYYFICISPVLFCCVNDPLVLAADIKSCHDEAPYGLDVLAQLSTVAL
jgi:hypothetical protein